MLKAGIGHSDELDSFIAARKAIEAAKNNLGELIPQVGIVFAGLEFDHQIILDEISNKYPSIQLIGCTSGGELTSELGFSDDSLVLLLLHSDEVQFSIGYGYDPEMNSDRASKMAYNMAKSNSSESEKLCIVFTDSFTLSGNRVIEVLNETVAPECKIFGGVSARPFVTNLTTKQFFNKQVLSNSVVLLLFSGPIEYRYSVSNTWQPIGRKAKVTRVNGKKLLQIDEMRALDYFHYYLGEYSFPAPEFPLAVYENDSENFYIRVPGGYDKDEGSILFAGEIKEGTTIQLTEALRDFLVDDLDRESSKKGIEDSFSPSLAFAFSCIVRKQLLGTKVKEEISILKKNLPTAMPIFGFYTYGEIAPLENQIDSNLHNCTMITLLIGTKSKNESSTNDKKTTNQVVVENSIGKESLEENQEREILKLRRDLARESSYRINLENVKDFHSSALRTVNHEIEAAKRVIQSKNDELERLNQKLEEEKKRADLLLLNVLPEDVANELKSKGSVEPKYFDSASVLFTDFKGFTKIASHLTARELVKELDFYFTEFDRIIESFGLEKLKTIGDAYMCAAGLPNPSKTHALDLVSAAIEIQNFMEAVKERRPKDFWELRIGIHSGPVLAGVIGTKKFSYDVWGDTVNVASRLESNGEPGKINISKDTFLLVHDIFDCEYRGDIEIKNKGKIEMYFVNGRKGN